MNNTTHTAPSVPLNTTPQRASFILSSLRVLSQNVNKKWTHLESLFEERKRDTDILLIQEPPWQTIRHTVSATDRDGEAVVGGPTHPDWIVMYHRTGRPRTMTYISKRLAKLRLAFRSDIVDDSDIIVTTLNLGNNNKTHIMNVYNDAQSRALK